MVKWLRTHTSNAGGAGLIPGGGTKIIYVFQHIKSCKVLPEGYNSFFFQFLNMIQIK